MRLIVTGPQESCVSTKKGKLAVLVHDVPAGRVDIQLKSAACSHSGDTSMNLTNLLFSWSWKKREKNPVV